MTLSPPRRDPIDSIDSINPVGSLNPTHLLDPVAPLGGCEPPELLQRGVDGDQVVTVITTAAGADTVSVEALEAVVAGLQRTQAARTLPATQVPTEILRQALLRQGEAPS